MISVVMPYWKRPDALRACVATYREFYGPALDIVVVDDGDDCPDVDARVLRLPKKAEALNPCVPFNRGVLVARGDVLVLTNPEVIHKTAILEGMLDALDDIGARGYVAAACWSPSQGWWYCHSTKGAKDRAQGRAPIPPGAGLHFCAMLRRSLYDMVGGFSEEYRDGQGYEDNDFLWKLHRAGAQFKICNSLVTEHIQCPPTKWPEGGLARNRAIFESRWGK